MKTFKKRKDKGAETATFSVFMGLTREEDAAAAALAAEEGDVSGRAWVRRVAREAIKARLAAWRQSPESRGPS